MDQKAKQETKLSTEPYKGVRDFYPEDMAVQNYIFDTWKKVAKEAGFVEYSASLLEPAELYRAKSGDELVNDQMFTFTDKGDREVALRPEMTPTFARMVAARRKSLKFPLKWFSIPNLFRYEKPQRGRKREHWQLNCDIVGMAGVDGDVEIISLAYNIMRAFEAKDGDFEIQISYAGLLSDYLEKELPIDREGATALIKLLDNRKKITSEELEKKTLEIVVTEEKKNKLIKMLSEELAGKLTSDSRFKHCQEIKMKLENKGIRVGRFDTYLTRGFDYYTGMIFEVYDTSPENNRSLFGGGRYDNLLEIFGVEPVPTVGFGMGDITMRDFLETHNLPLCEN